MTKLSPKIRSRMEKLLSLSRDKSNDHEAMLAMEKLYAMLAEHNLSVAELDSENEVIGQAQFTTDNRPWRRDIAAGISMLYFCEMYYTINRKSGVTIFLTGTDANREFALALIKNVTKTIYCTATKNSREIYGYVHNSYVTSFLNAASERIFERCEALKETGEAGKLKTETGNTLPCLVSLYESETQKIREFFEKNNIFPKYAPFRNISVRSNRGYHDGLDAGDRVNLCRGIESRAPSLLESK